MIAAIVMMLVLGGLLGLGLGIADSKLKVEVDERVEHVTGMLLVITVEVVVTLVVLDLQKAWFLEKQINSYVNQQNQIKKLKLSNI